MNKCPCWVACSYLFCLCVFHLPSLLLLCFKFMIFNSIPASTAFAWPTAYLQHFLLLIKPTGFLFTVESGNRNRFSAQPIPDNQDVPSKQVRHPGVWSISLAIFPIHVPTVLAEKDCLCNLPCIKLRLENIGLRRTVPCKPVSKLFYQSKLILSDSFSVTLFKNVDLCNDTWRI